MAGPRVNDGRARLVAFDKNAPGATTLAGTSDIRLLKGTPSLRDYVNKRRQEKEKEKNKGGGGDPGDEAWYYPEGADIQVSKGPNEDKFSGYPKDESSKDKVVLGDGVPGTDGEGWRLYTLQEAIVSADDKTAPLKITSVSDSHSIKLPTHPLENGMIKHDHKVIQPATLRVTGLVDRSFSIKFSQMLKTYLGAKDLMAYFVLRSPWKYFPRMYIQGFTSRANTQRYDVYEYTINLTELLIATSVIDKTNVADLASTSNQGAQSPKQ
jgi:hypothetical protein